MPAGDSRYIMFPVCPIIEQGEIVVTISAFSAVNRDTEECVIEVGVSCYQLVEVLYLQLQVYA